MSAANRKKTKSFRKVGGRGMKLLKKQGLRKMTNRQYARYIFWITITVIIMSTLYGS